MTCAKSTSKFRFTAKKQARRLRRVLAVWRRSTALSRQRRALAALDDRLLDDIGLTRAQAEAEVRKGFWEV